MSTALAATTLALPAGTPGPGAPGQAQSDAGGLFALLLAGILPVIPTSPHQPAPGTDGQIAASSQDPSPPQLASFPKPEDDSKMSLTAAPAASTAPLASEQAVPASTLPVPPTQPAPAIAQPKTLDRRPGQAGTAPILEKPSLSLPQVQLATPDGTASTADPGEQNLPSFGIAPRARPAIAQLATVSAPASEGSLDAAGQVAARRSAEAGAAKPQHASGSGRWAPGLELPASPDRTAEPVSGRLDLNQSQAPSLRPASIQLRAQAPIGPTAGVQLEPINQTGDLPVGDSRGVASIDGADLPTGRTERGSFDLPVPPTPAATPALQIGYQIVRAAHQRVERMVVQLEPAELGRVEVRLDFGHEGKVSALIATDRPDTLDVLQRDARTLERSLEQAGLRLDSGGLSFALKRDGGQGQPSAGAPWSELGGDPSSPKAGVDQEAQPGRPAMLSLRLLDLQV